MDILYTLIASEVRQQQTVNNSAEVRQRNQTSQELASNVNKVIHMNG